MTDMMMITMTMIILCVMCENNDNDETLAVFPGCGVVTGGSV